MILWSGKPVSEVFPRLFHNEATIPAGVLGRLHWARHGSLFCFLFTNKQIPGWLGLMAYRALMTPFLGLGSVSP